MLSAPHGSAWCLAEPLPRILILYALKREAIFTLASVWQLESWGLYVPLDYWPWFLGFPHSATHMSACTSGSLYSQLTYFCKNEMLITAGGFIGPCWAGVLTPEQWEYSWSMAEQALAEQTHFPPSWQQLLCQPLTSRMYLRGGARTGRFSLNRTDSKAN